MTLQDGPLIQTRTGTDVINFGLGQPSPQLLPLEEIAEAAQRSLGPGSDRLVLQYGVARGPARLRAALAGLLTDGLAHPVFVDELAITGGISLSLSMASQVFGRSRRRVACGDPTYFLARGIFETQGLEVVGIPVDERGLDVDQLTQALVDGLEIDFVYCIPQFHNPTGANLSSDRADALVSLAEQYDFLIVADEPYALLGFGSPPPCMMSYDRGRARVLSLGSFSKILGPGLRLGWAHAAPPLLDRFMAHGTFRSGGALNPVVGGIVQDTLLTGFLGRHIAMLRDTFAKRATRLAQSLTQKLPQARFVPADGGYFMWIDLGEHRDALSLCERGQQEYGVSFTAGSRCAISRDLASHARLSFAFYNEDELEEGVGRLAKLLGEISP